MSLNPSREVSGALPRVSVVIPVRNEARAVRQCVEDVLAQDYPAGLLEVVVVDGQSEDNTREIVATMASRDARVRVLENPGQIASCALNIGIAAARGDVIARMDAHTRYARDYLAQCARVLCETGADNVGGPAATEARGYLQRTIAAAYHSRFAVGNARFHQIGYEGLVDTVTYGCWPRSTFSRFGVFDEELVRNQDDEHNLRIARGGGKIWQSPRIRSWYSPRGSLSSLFHQYFQYGYWKVRVIQKHRLPASWRHLVPGAFVATVLLLAAGSPLWAVSWVALVAVLGFYSLAMLVASLVTAARSGWGLLPALPPVFACYHTSYGLGFLCGIVDFVLLRRRGRFTRLTRGAEG